MTTGRPACGPTRSHPRATLGAALAAFALVGALLAGCSSSGGSSEPSGGQVPQQAGGAQQADGGSAALPGAAATPGTGAGQAARQVVRNGELSLTVDDPIAAAERVAGIADRLGGRVDQREQAAGTDGDAGSASLTIRVPAASLEDAVTQLGSLGTLTRYTEKSEDVTGSVVDLDARISAAQASVDRVQGFLQHTSSTTELLATEQALSERQSQLEQLRGQRAALGDQVAMSTLAVTLTAPGHPAAEAPGPRTFLDGLGLGWHALLTGARVMSVVLGVLAPWLVAAAVLVAAIVGSRRWYRRRHPARPSATMPALAGRPPMVPPTVVPPTAPARAPDAAPHDPPR